MKKSYFLYGSGTLKQKDNSLYYELKSSSKFLPVENVDHIHVLGQAKFNTKVFDFLNKNRIRVTFYSYYGNIIGHFTPNSNRLGKQLIKQVEVYQNPLRRKEFAQKLHLASAFNNIQVVRYYEKKGYDLSVVRSEMDNIYRNMKLIDIHDEDFLNKMDLAEARLKQQYYRILDIILKETTFTFEARITKPPGNPVNAMMSFGYSMIYAEIYKALDDTSLCPEIGFIHGNSRKSLGSLVFDIADLFKPQLVDRLILRLIHSAQIKQEHFYKKNSGTYLNIEGRNILTDSFSKYINQTHIDERNGKTYSYKQFMVREVYEIANAVINDREYKPVIFRS